MVYPVVLLAMVGGLVAPARAQDPLPCGTYGINPGDKVVVQSHNFPENYGPKQRCVWKVTCNPRESTLMTFDCPVFDLEESVDCTSDKLALKLTGKDVKKYCGTTTTPDGLTTTDGFVRLRFASNKKVHKQGFRCNIRCRDAAATTPATTTPVPTTITSATPTTTTTTNPTTTITTATTPTTTTPITTTTTVTTTTTEPTTTTTTTPTTTTTTPTMPTTTPPTTTTAPTIPSSTATTTTSTATTSTATAPTTTTTPDDCFWFCFDWWTRMNGGR